MRVGILTQFPSPAVQSGPAIHTRFLNEGLNRRGHDVLLMGPDTTSLAPVSGNTDHIWPSFSYPTHPDVKVSMPGAPQNIFKRRPDIDVIHGQCSSHMMHYGIWARKMWGIPFLNTHIIHFPTHAHFILSDRLYQNDVVREWWEGNALGMEKSFAKNFYNQSDCLIVQSRHYVKYWRERGVTSPIEVVGRPINPGVFSKQAGADPFPADFKVGKRLLVVCRHDREKNLHYLIDLFAKEIASRDPDVTLTLVGDGHDHQNLVERAWGTGVADRIHFSGEVKHDSLVDWYSHADLFVYTSLSETFGNVVNEALWCGVPVVALDDRMGVAGQVVDGVNGALIEPGEDDTDHAFTAAVLSLLANRPLRRQMAGEAANLSRRSAHPDVVLSRFENIYAEARRHVRGQIPKPLCQQNKLAQMRTFSKHYASWAMWNGLLLSLAHAATRLGASRSGGASQHEAVIEKAARKGLRLRAVTGNRPAA